MIKVWEKSKVDLYFEDVENEKLVRQGFNNLKNEATEEEIGSLVGAIDSLHELPAVHAIVSDSHRYIV